MGVVYLAFTPHLKGISSQSNMTIINLNMKFNDMY